MFSIFSIEICKNTEIWYRTHKKYLCFIWVIISLQLMHRYLLKKVFSKIWCAFSGLSRIFDQEWNQLFSFFYGELLSCNVGQCNGSVHSNEMLNPKWRSLNISFNLIPIYEFLTIAKWFCSIYLNFVSTYVVMHFIMMSSDCLHVIWVNGSVYSNEMLNHK